MGLIRFELMTSPLSGVRSNQLSYRPAIKKTTTTRKGGDIRLPLRKEADRMPVWVYEAIVIFIQFLIHLGRRSLKTKQWGYAPPRPCGCWLERTDKVRCSAFRFPGG